MFERNNSYWISKNLEEFMFSVSDIDPVNSYKNSIQMD